MKVILKQDIKGIGKKDEIHEVSDALAQLAGAPIDKKKIELETKDIKDAGVFNGKVRLHVGVVASFKIMVEVEQA